MIADKFYQKIVYGISIGIVWIFVGFSLSYGQPESRGGEADENDYYKMITVPTPQNVAFEISGMDLQSSGDLVVSTRRGEIWLIENPYYQDIIDATPHYRRIASGLHTPMGLASKNGNLYTAQRTELTELSDTSGDGIIDIYRTFRALPSAPNYNEFIHGPIVLPNGNFWVNMSLADVNWFKRIPPFGVLLHLAPWKGWALQITPDGELVPYAAGLRSPAGMGIGENGEMYYTENQGMWVGTGFLAVVEEGDFYGHPSSLLSADRPGSPIDLTPSDIPIQDSLMLHEAAERIPELTIPAVRLPHGVLGTSLMWVLEDTTKGAFGPFEGQLFVADWGQSKMMRVDLEKVNGRYQGVAFNFREGFKTGPVRSTWGEDGSMFVGLSERWGPGQTEFGLQRLKWTGKIPFEMKTVRAKVNGFEIEFTKPVDLHTAKDPSSYTVQSFEYLYHMVYGSPPVDLEESAIRSIHVSEDKLKVRLVLNNLRRGYIYEINGSGIRSAVGEKILHPGAYYSLNEIPEKDTADSVVLKQNDENARQKTNEQGKINDDFSGNEANYKHQTQMPSSWSAGPDQVINIGTKPGLKFDTEQISVSAGSRIKLVFSNTDDMLHNLVITDPESATEVGKQAAEMGIAGPKQEYVPDTEQVLYYTSLLQPGTSQTIYFTAPDKPGSYEFVCTFPGHYMTMRGTIVVEP
ncbi:plastocyanin/azurin family copper-binding protein [Halalkalibaculum sp. DA384]|uniref:plastocyanin/azurin family copper-binding protein n=1 Tax=Halalkalibaculum sp. DA384 TaxID=3373606 RepID=UPI00375432AE